RLIQSGSRSDAQFYRRGEKSDRLLGLIRPQDGRLDLLRKTALIQKADTVSQPMRIDGAFEIVRVRSREDRQLPLDDRSVRFEVNQAVAREQLAAQFETRLRNLLAGARVEGL
ncbi:hypothetical protein, partial [Pseudomonas aeruginosa]|uniref:hypothetical protein n=1 Tax=Pseudomonas aeruginosa TaxID=287 RepID=UPI00402B689F